MQFEWDHTKAGRNAKKHRVSFNEAVTVSTIRWLQCSMTPITLPPLKSENAMKPKAHLTDDLRPEYHFDYSKAVRGKYYKRILKEGTNVVILEPDIAKAFPSSAAVNDVLRVVLKAGQAAQRIYRTGGRTKRRRAA